MNEEKLRKIISDCFVQLKKKFYENYTIEEYEDDTNPQILAKRDVIESLPPPSIKILEVINDSVESKHAKGFLFKYDYTPQDNKIEFCGSVSSNDPKLRDTNIRLTLDYPEDFKLFEQILINLKEPFNLKDIVNFLHSRKDVQDLNKDVKEIYWKNYEKKATKIKMKKG